MSKKEEERAALYAELHKLVQNGEDERVAKVASKILHIFPQDEIAFRTKVIAKINLGLFNEALSHLRENPLGAGLKWEEAYSLYRLQKMEDAKAVLEGWKDGGLERTELMYQILYRLDRFEEAYDMLADLIKKSEDDMDDERQTNLAAVEASLKLVKSPKKVKHIHGTSYEMLYNEAVGLIGDGKIVEAEALLGRAEALGRDTLQEEGGSEEDMIDELGLIEAQRAYCLQMMGKVKEALAIYSKIVKSKPSDVGLSAVLANNILCGNVECSIFDSKKRLKIMASEEVLAKMNRIQRRDMLLNECLFDLHIHHVDETKRLCTLIEKTYPELKDAVTLIRFSLMTWTDNITVARKHFLGTVEKNSEPWLNICLASAQIAIENGYRDAAIDFLRDLDQHVWRPGVVSAVVTLFHGKGMVQKAGDILRQAVEHYRYTGKNQDSMKLLWRQSATFMMAQGDFKGSAASLEELRKTTGDDPLILAQLVVAYSQFDMEKAKNLSTLLPPMPPSQLDATVLESPSWPSHLRMLKRGLKGEPTPATTKSDKAEVKKEKSKKKKKAKLPANYEVERKPDPERWLPKYERTGYRPRKTRKGRGDVGKGTQGADSASAAIYDMSGKVGQKGQAPEDSPAPNTSAWRRDHNKKKTRRKK